MDEVQKRISRAQAMNCAVQVMQQADKSLPDEDFKALILKWRDWFYEKLNDDVEIPVGTPIPIFHPKKENLTPDQYGFVPKKGEKKIDLRGEPVCRICGGTESNLQGLVRGEHPQCRAREQMKLKDLQS